MTIRDSRCCKCRKVVKSFHAFHTDRGLCKFCNQRYTFLPDGSMVTWEVYHAYHKSKVESKR